MSEDSPLLTPEGPGGRPPARRDTRQEDDDRLLTPEEERLERTTSKASGRGVHANGADKARNGKRKQGEAEDAGAGNSNAAPNGGGAQTTYAAGEKYRKIKKVGVGAYGSVFMAENLETKEIVAVKVTTRTEDQLWGGFPVSLLREIAILRSLKHENIVQLHDLTHNSSGDPLMVMEYCQSSLYELLNSRKHDMSFSEVKYVIRQVLDACRHMHERGILHRDLATKNVLFNTSGEIKVCDFGISRFAFGQDEEFGFVSARNLEDPNMIVSLPYRAVELLLGQANYGPALDVWAAGCIMGEILLCQGGVRRPFFGGDPENPNRTPQALVEEIFSMCGRPTEQTWPGLGKLPLLKPYSSGGSRIDRLPAHSGDMPNEERMFLRKFFASGAGKCAHSKYSLTEACFDLLGSLCTLCPEKRQTAKDALKHNFFAEKPMPEWHAWHWAMGNSEIARGNDVKRQERDAGDDARAMLRKLSSNFEDSGAPGEAKGAGQPKTMKERRLEELERRANEKRQQEERRKAARKEEELPPGWTKHWSSSKQRYYYHDSATGENRWSPPTATARR